MPIEAAPAEVRPRFMLEWFRENSDRVQLLVDGCTLYLVVNGQVHEPQHANTPAQAADLAHELERGDTVR